MLNSSMPKIMMQMTRREIRFRLSAVSQNSGNTSGGTMKKALIFAYIKRNSFLAPFRTCHGKRCTF